MVHGLSNPGTDDRDEMGVCIEPPAYLLGFRRFEHFVYRRQPEGVPSGPGDLDLTVYGLRKYCQLALKGSQTVLLPLFVDDEHGQVRHARAAHRLPGDRAGRTGRITLPAHPDVDAVDRFVVSACRRAWDAAPHERWTRVAQPVRTEAFESPRLTAPSSRPSRRLAHHQ